MSDPQGASLAMAAGARGTASLWPLAAFDRADHAVADRLLDAWGHYLGPCRRPFGRQAFVLAAAGAPVAVAVSASTVGVACAGYTRFDVVELARLCAAPDAAWATRVALRLWRELAPAEWARAYWPVRALVSYASAAHGHSGDVYRFDGWRRAPNARKGAAGPNGGHQAGARYGAKTVWVYALPAPAPVTA